MEQELQRQLMKELPVIVEEESQGKILFDYTDLGSVHRQIGMIIDLAKKFGLDRAANWLEWRRPR